MKSEGFRMVQILSGSFEEKTRFRTPYWKSRQTEKLSKLLKMGPKVSVPSFEFAKVNQVQELPLSTHLG